MTETFDQKREILDQEDFKKYEYFAELLAYGIVKAEKGSEFLIVSGILDHRVFSTLLLCVKLKKTENLIFFCFTKILP